MAAAADKSVGADGWKHGTLPRTREQELSAEGYDHVYGVDEAGRGPLAGPVVAAACMVPSSICIEGVHDSKKLTEEQREKLYKALTTNSKVKWATALVDNDRIDRINILEASMQAMVDAVDACKPPTDKSYVLVDGPYVPKTMKIPGEPVIKGDSKCYSIAAASIIAKVTRDRIMGELSQQYPVYSLHEHKGYPTSAHMAAVSKHGPSPIHRLTFAPLKTMDLSKCPDLEKKRALALAEKERVAALKKQVKLAEAAAKKEAKKLAKQAAALEAEPMHESTGEEASQERTREQPKKRGRPKKREDTGMSGDPTVSIREPPIMRRRSTRLNK